jgi:putative membrane protein
MFIDFLALMLIILVAGMLLFAVYFFWFLEDGQKKMAPGFLVVGFLQLVTGLKVIFSWPLPGSFNISFGEPAVLFGALFFTLGLALLLDWDLLSLGIVAIIGGIVAIIVGLRLANLGMTKEPIVAMLGYVLTGIVGIAALPGYWLRRYPIIRILVSLAALGAAIIWAITGFGSYWGHLESFAKYKP